MTLQQLHYAIVISETGSMNKAAERLYIAQPSLTGAMQELERELGITIFHRSGRGVTLTNDGQEFIDYARQVYHQYETLAEKYAHPNELKKKFGVTTQHYSFAVKAFVEMAKSFDTAKYDFAIRGARRARSSTTSQACAARSASSTSATSTATSSRRSSARTTLSSTS